MVSEEERTREGELVLQMKKREKKRSESKTIKILNALATIAMHICTITVAIGYKCTIMHKQVSVFFCSNCVKLTTFSILHNYAQVDVIALTLYMTMLLRKLKV